MHIMHVISARNVNDALSHGIKHLLADGIKEPSRNGPVLVSPGPVVTVYNRPWERVLFSPLRDANCFFHVMEAMWMLAGNNDLKFPQYFNSKFGAYSDDKVTVRAAYGHRWRKWFGYDQLGVIIEQLKADPSSRRAVLAMWDGGATGYWYDVPGTASVDEPSGDLLADTVDKPCNTHIYFRIQQGRLDMTVCCRSNDIIWGAYGANAVHMSFLHEYMALALGVSMGLYYQFSNNYHLYTNLPLKCTLEELATDAEAANIMYSRFDKEGTSKHIPLFRDRKIFDIEVKRFVTNALATYATSPQEYTEPFLRTVAHPMLSAWMQRKLRQGTGQELCGHIKALDWATASYGWVSNRESTKGSV